MKSAEILVLDDDPMLGEQLRALLEVLGHRAIYISNVVKAMRLLEETTFDAVFCDYWIPPQGGQAFYRQLASVRPELTSRLVFVVAGVLGDETQLFIKSTGAPQLLKPFKLEAVRLMAQSVLEREIASESTSAGGDPAL
jgi:DNA-binding NtrC family response regulator